MKSIKSVFEDWQEDVDICEYCSRALVLQKGRLYVYNAIRTQKDVQVTSLNAKKTKNGLGSYSVFLVSSVIGCLECFFRDGKILTKVKESREKHRTVSIKIVNEPQMAPKIFIVQTSAHKNPSFQDCHKIILKTPCS